MKYTDTIKFEPKKKSINIIIEPVCFDYEIQPGEKIRIEGQSDIEGKFEIEEYDGTKVIWQWDGSTLKVFINDVLDLDFDTPIPISPQGKSSKDFVNLLFGGPGGPTQPLKKKKWWEIWK